MTDNKVQITTNGAKHQDWMQDKNTQKHIDENMVLVDKNIPINPETGKPYFKINENAWDGEWVAGEVKPIPSGEFGGDDE